jgi:hypothetical protein
MDPIQPPTQPPPQTPPEVFVTQPNPNYLKTIIFSVLAIITLGLIAYLIFQNQKLQKQVLYPSVSPTIKISSPTPQTVSLISIPSDETAGWKSYNDIKYNYSFKYPESFVDKTNPNDKNLGNFTLESNEKEMIYGTTFTGVPDLENDKKNNGSSKSFIINEGKYLFVSYTECAGQGCNLSKKHIDVFDQILSTFQFLK